MHQINQKSQKNGSHNLSNQEKAKCRKIAPLLYENLIFDVPGPSIPCIYIRNVAFLTDVYKTGGGRSAEKIGMYVSGGQHKEKIRNE